MLFRFKYFLSIRQIAKKRMIIKAFLILITGKFAAVNAILLIRSAGIFANVIKNVEINGTGGSSAAINPRIVTGATNGAANIFAKIEVIDR